MLLEKILIVFKNIEKQYAIDSIAEKTSYSVLPLPPYQCILNPIEMAWNQWKYHVLHLNVYTNKPLKGMNLIRKVCKEHISTENWVNRRRKVSYHGPYSWSLNLILFTCLRMMMLIIVGMKCNKYPGICKYFENFIEIFYINLPNTVKSVHNRRLRFLKKGL